MTEFTSKNGKLITLRPPTLDDVQITLNYINELVEEKAMIALDQLQDLEKQTKYINSSVQEIADKNKIQFLAFDQDVLAANAEIRKGSLKETHLGSLGISVAKDYRGEGVGKFMIQHLLKTAKTELDVSTVKLEVLAINQPAIGLYQKLGFTEYGRLPNGVNHYGNIADKIFMYKNL